MQQGKQGGGSSGRVAGSACKPAVVLPARRCPPLLIALPPTFPPISIIPLCVQILQGLLPKESVRGAPPPDKKLLEHHFVFACIWAFGGCLLVDKLCDYRQVFSRWWQSEHKAVLFPPEVRQSGGKRWADCRAQRRGSMHKPALASPCDALCLPVHRASPRTHISSPSLQGTVFDYYVQHEGENVCMAHWTQRVPQFTYMPGAPPWAAAPFIPFNPPPYPTRHLAHQTPPATAASHVPPTTDNFASLFVPTVETTRLSYLLDLLLPNQKHVMFVGNSGAPGRRGGLVDGGPGRRLACAACMLQVHQISVQLQLATGLNPVPSRHRHRQDGPDEGQAAQPGPGRLHVLHRQHELQARRPRAAAGTGDPPGEEGRCVGGRGGGSSLDVRAHRRVAPAGPAPAAAMLQAYRTQLPPQTPATSVPPSCPGMRFGPPGSKRLIYFVDDMSLPFVDKYDTQSAIELLRQHIDYHGWSGDLRGGGRRRCPPVSMPVCMLQAAWQTTALCLLSPS